MLCHGMVCRVGKPESTPTLHHGMLSPPLVTRDTKPEEIGRYMIGAQSQREKAIA